MTIYMEGNRLLENFLSRDLAARQFKISPFLKQIGCRKMWQDFHIHCIRTILLQNKENM